MVRRSGHLDRYGHRAQTLLLVRYAQAHDLFPQFLGSLLAILQGCTRQNNGELIARPIAKSKVAWPPAETFSQKGAEPAQHRVPSRVPEVRVELLEVIDVNHDDPHGLDGGTALADAPLGARACPPN